MTSGPEPLLLVRGHPVPLACQLAAGLEAAIRDGLIHPGARLPSARDLARRLGVHRSTVGAAYARLCRRGCIDRGAGRCPRARGGPVGPSSEGDREGPDEVSAGRAAHAIVRDAMGRAYREGLSRQAIFAAFAEAPSVAVASVGSPIGLFEPRPGLRRVLACELERRLGVPVQRLARPRLAGGTLLIRREVRARLTERDDTALSLPVDLCGGTRERGLVRRSVRTGLVVLLSASRVVRCYASELAVREFSRGVSFAAFDPAETRQATRAAVAARLVLVDAMAIPPPTRARVERVRLVPDAEIRGLRRYLDLPESLARTPVEAASAPSPPAWCGT